MAKRTAANGSKRAAQRRGERKRSKGVAPDGRETATGTVSSTTANRIGRPLAITPRIEAEIVRLLETGLSYAAVCEQVGVSRPTIFAHRKRSAAFDARCREACDAADDRVEDALRRDAISQDGSHQARVFWLCNRRPDRWRMRPVDERLTVTIEDVNGLADRFADALNAHVHDDELRLRILEAVAPRSSFQPAMGSDEEASDG